MGSSRVVVFVFSWVFAGMGCTGGAGTDGGTSDGSAVESGRDAATVCRNDNDCADTVFCNGAERCMPGAAGANARGCVAAVPPCSGVQTCDEANRRCVSMCTDSDGDGHAAVSCGGDDCDDNDANRFPGHAEVCDPSGHDEDCSACTVAGDSPDGDADHDSFVSLSCFNAYTGPTPSCDPLRTRVDATRTRVTGSDCDDTNPNVRPNQVEVCNDTDDNCNAMVDEGDPGGGGSCGSPSPSVCRSGVNHCVAGAVTCQLDFSTPGYCCAGFADCNADTHDGCEANLGIDASNCGACGAACPTTGGTPVCASAMCGYATCTMGRTLCGGACVDVTTDVTNCGACGSACSNTGGTPACAAGRCGYNACRTGLTLCNGDCADLTSDPANCGGCSQACPGIAGGFATCSASVCGVACPPGRTQCGSVCVDLTSDNSNCGGCGAVCAPTGHASSAVCVASVCDVTACTPPFLLDCGGANDCAVDSSSDDANCGACGNRCPSTSTCYAGVCSLRAPRQIAPLSTSTVTSQQPALHWQLAAGTDGAQIRLCRDRAMTSGCLAPIDASGTSGATPSPLATGVWYWRLFGRSGTSTGTIATPVWQFTVGARSAAHDMSFGTTPDVNGDGVADILVGANSVASSAGRVHGFYGRSSGIATSPSLSLSGPAGSNGTFGSAIASAGDVNGDGFGDVIIGAPGVSSSTGRAYLYLGGATGLATAPSTVLVGPDGPSGFFGSAVASAGDVNADGYADVIVGAYGVPMGSAPNYGKVYVYLGSASGLATSPVNTIACPTGVAGIYPRFGYAVASAGDSNGDGFEDVVVGAWGVSTGSGVVYLFRGGPAGLGTSPSLVFAAPTSGTSFGRSIAGPADLDGDGYSDLVVGAPNGGVVHVYQGGPSGLPTSPTASRTGPDGADFGLVLSVAGDLNADGYADVLVGNESYSVGTFGVTTVGRAYVLLGGSTGIALTATALAAPGSESGHFGCSVAIAGDTNGDGFADAAIGAFNMSAGGATYVYNGRAAGLPATPTTLLMGPDGAGGSFGISVASVARRAREGIASAARTRAGAASVRSHRN